MNAIKTFSNESPPGNTLYFSASKLDALLKQGPIMLYDGKCVFCNDAVRYAAENEPEKTLRFASLQSATGRALMNRFGLPAQEPSTFIIIKNGTAYTRFEAAVQLGKIIGGDTAKLANVLDFMTPSFIGNTAYSFLWPLRKIFGAKDQCIIPAPEFRARVIDL